MIGKHGQLAKSLQKQRNVHAFSSKELNLHDLSPLKEMDFDVLINAAAYNFTEKAEVEQELVLFINGHAVGQLSEIAKGKGAVFVHVSSDFVFSGTKGTPYTEEDSIGPLSVYGNSKALGESLALKYSSSYVFRTASLYSEGGSNFRNTMIERALSGKELKVIEDIVMSPTHADHLADMIYRSLDRKIPFGLYHAVNKGAASWYDFARKIFDAKGMTPSMARCSYKDFPSGIKRPLYSVLDVSKLEKEIGEIPTWEAALEF